MVSRPTVDYFHSKYEFAIKNLELHFNRQKLLQAPDITIQGKNVISSEKELSKSKLENFQQLNNLSFLITLEAAFVYPQPITNTQMQRSFNKFKSTISKHINKLVQNGYLEYKLDLQDIRSKPLVITKKGAKIIFHLHQELDKHMANGIIKDLVVTNLQ